MIQTSPAFTGSTSPSIGAVPESSKRGVADQKKKRQRLQSQAEQDKKAVQRMRALMASISDGTLVEEREINDAVLRNLKAYAKLSRSR